LNFNFPSDEPTDLTRHPFLNKPLIASCHARSAAELMPTSFYIAGNDHVRDH
jgi:hypothetical protein